MKITKTEIGDILNNPTMTGRMDRLQEISREAIEDIKPRTQKQATIFTKELFSRESRKVQVSEILTKHYGINLEKIWDARKRIDSLATEVKTTICRNMVYTEELEKKLHGILQSLQNNSRMFSDSTYYLNNYFSDMRSRDMLRNNNGWKGNTEGELVKYLTGKVWWPIRHVNNIRIGSNWVIPGMILPCRSMFIKDSDGIAYLIGGAEITNPHSRLTLSLGPWILYKEFSMNGCMAAFGMQWPFEGYGNMMLDSRGGICAGGFGDHLNRATRKSNLIAYLDIMTALFQTYTDEGYQKLEYFATRLQKEGQLCSACRVWFDSKEDKGIVCNSCSTKVHTRCFITVCELLKIIDLDDRTLVQTYKNLKSKDYAGDLSKKICGSCAKILVPQQFLSFVEGKFRDPSVSMTSMGIRRAKCKECDEYSTTTYGNGVCRDCIIFCECCGTSYPGGMDSIYYRKKRGSVARKIICPYCWNRKSARFRTSYACIRDKDEIETIRKEQRKEVADVAAGIRKEIESYDKSHDNAQDSVRDGEEQE